jgi:hypothetical protein
MEPAGIPCDRSYQFRGLRHMAFSVRSRPFRSERDFLVVRKEMEVLPV